MFRGNRLLIIAAGLVLACANPANAEGGEQKPQAEQSVAKSLGDIAAANNQQAERAKRSDQDEAPCGQRQYGSSADLCAQWKAADAASDSAWWAWIAAISTIVSTTAVLIAIGLTFQANTIARATAKRELRAYVFPVGLSLDWEIGLLSYSQSARITVLIRNAGNTPTRNLQLVVEHATELREHEQFCRINANGPFSLLAPQETVSSPTLKFNVEDTTNWFKQHKPIYIYGGFFYDDVFGVKRETRFCYQIHFSKIGESDYPNNLTWNYIGRHNCSDEECVSARAAANTANDDSRHRSQ